MGAQQLGLEALWCLAWPESFEPEPIAVRATSAPAVLLLAGEHDPASPIGFAEQIQSELANGFHVLRCSGEGHTVAPNSPCAVDSMAAFVADPSVAPNLRCDD